MGPWDSKGSQLPAESPRESQEAALPMLMSSLNHPASQQSLSEEDGALLLFFQRQTHTKGKHGQGTKGKAGMPGVKASFIAKLEVKKLYIDGDARKAEADI